MHSEMNANQLTYSYLRFVSGHLSMLSEMQCYLRWTGGQICMAQLDVESPFRFSSFILFIDSLLHHTAAIQKSHDAKKTQSYSIS